MEGAHRNNNILQLPNMLCFRPHHHTRRTASKHASPLPSCPHTRLRAPSSALSRSPSSISLEVAPTDEQRQHVEGVLEAFFMRGFHQHSLPTIAHQYVMMLLLLSVDDLLGCFACFAANAAGRKSQQKKHQQSATITTTQASQVAGTAQGKVASSQSLLSLSLCLSLCPTSLSLFCHKHDGSAGYNNNSIIDASCSSVSAGRPAGSGAQLSRTSSCCCCFVIIAAANQEQQAQAAAAEKKWIVVIAGAAYSAHTAEGVCG